VISRSISYFRKKFFEALKTEGVVEPREKLGLHAVVEEILLLEVIPEVEDLSDIDLAVLVDGLGGELDAAGRRGDPAEDLVVEGLEGAGAQEQHVPRVDLDRGALRNPILGDRQIAQDLLALDQGEQRLLDVEPRDVGLAADDSGDLVDLVDADRGVLHVDADVVRGGIRPEKLTGTLFQTVEEPVRVDQALVGGQGVGVHDDDRAVLRELFLGVIEVLHGAHDGRLAGSRVAQQQKVAVGLALEVLEDRHRDEAQRLFLPDDILLEELVDLGRSHDGPWRGFKWRVGEASRRLAADGTGPSAEHATRSRSPWEMTIIALAQVERRNPILGASPGPQGLTY